MTLAQYLRILRGQWLIVVALTIAFTVGAAVFSWTRTPIYSATAQMFVTTRGDDSDISALTQGSTFTQQRVKSYVSIVKSPGVLQPVIDNLKLEGSTPQGLAPRISASSPPNTVLLNVTAEDASPERAAAIANGVAAQFTKYVTELELPSGTGTSPVKVTVTSPAVIPTVPISPRTTLNLALGLLLGLGLGVGAAVLRDSLDRTVGGRHDAGEVAQAPVLSGVIEDEAVKDSPLIIHDAFSPRAEAFRQLRTNIRFLSVDHEVRSLVVTSSVAAEGKSLTAANLAIAMAQGGDKVVLIDADLRRPSVAGLFGVSAGVGLTSVLLGDLPLADALQTWRDDVSLFVLTSGPVPPNPSELIGSHRMVEVVEGLVAQGYAVIVDSPPLLPVTDAAILARITSGALVVVRAQSTRVEQLEAAALSLRTAGAPILGVVVNRVPKKGGGYYYSYKYSYHGYRSSEGARVARPESHAAPAAPAEPPPVQRAASPDKLPSPNGVPVRTAFPAAHAASSAASPPVSIDGTGSLGQPPVPAPAGDSPSSPSLLSGRHSRLEPTAEP